MICLVTGAAGFIGSHLSQRLLEEGHKVVGIDSFTDFYEKWIKEKNISSLMNKKNFEFIPSDINTSDTHKLLEKVDCVFHLAAQAGVRTSWGESFAAYTKNNVDATQKLLETAKKTNLKKFIYASSSSVYGYCPELPMSETSPLFPFSPYGVTKLAGEHLCSLYYKNYGIPTVSLRYFTVYGPGQRPDMAFHKFFKAAHKGTPVSLYGDGSQTRDFTFIGDVIEGTLSAFFFGREGEIYNIGGGNRKKLEDVFPLIEEIGEKKIPIHKEATQKGDVPHTYADIRKAQRELKFSPKTPLEEGLKQEWLWLRKLYSFG